MYGFSVYRARVPMVRSTFAGWTLARFYTLSVKFGVLCVGLVVEVAMVIGWSYGSVFCCVLLLRSFFMFAPVVLVASLIR